MTVGDQRVRAEELGHASSASTLSFEDRAALVGVVAAVALGLACGTAGFVPSLRIAPHLEGSAAELLAITGRNLGVCSALLCVSHVRVLRTWWPRQVIDVVAMTIVLSAGFTAGLVASRAGGLAHLPHAPFELPAVALSAAWWWRHRLHPPRLRTTLARLTAVGLVLTFAAAVETFFVPHRQEAAALTAPEVLDPRSSSDLIRPVDLPKTRDGERDPR